MRIIRYYVVNKSTREEIFTHCKQSACEHFMAQLANAEEYAIGYKWLSI